MLGCVPHSAKGYLTVSSSLRFAHLAFGSHPTLELSRWRAVSSRLSRTSWENSNLNMPAAPRSKLRIRKFRLGQAERSGELLFPLGVGTESISALTDARRSPAAKGQGNPFVAFSAPFGKILPSALPVRPSARFKRSVRPSGFCGLCCCCRWSLYELKVSARKKI